MRHQEAKLFLVDSTKERERRGLRQEVRTPISAAEVAASPTILTSL
jgi:hypothetical protein